MPSLDLTRLSAWRTTPGLPTDGVVETTAVQCPAMPGAPALRFTLRDGVMADFDIGKSPPRERVQIQTDAVIEHGRVWSFGMWRCVRTWPVFTAERWQIDAQEHGAAPVQPLWALETQTHGTATRRRLNANAGRPAARYAPSTVEKRPVQVRDEWVWDEVVWLKTTAVDGWIEWWRGDTRIARIDGATSTETAKGPALGLANGWINLGIYRAGAVLGTAVMDVCGAQIVSGGRTGPRTTVVATTAAVRDDVQAVRATCLSIADDAGRLQRDAQAAAVMLATVDTRLPPAA